MDQPAGVAGLPPPPPALPETGPAVSRPARILFAVVFLLVFGRPWLSAVDADWAAAGLAALGAVEGFIYWNGPKAAAKALSLLAFAAMLWCFCAFGLSAGEAPAPSLDTVVLGALSLAAGCAALYLAPFAPAAADRRLACVLMLFSGAAALLAGATLCVAPSRPWLEGVQSLSAGAWASWLASGGAWRWGGLFALAAARWIWRRSDSKPDEEAPASLGRVANWNR